MNKSIVVFFVTGLSLLSVFAIAQEESASKRSGDESTLYLESTLVGDKEQPTVSYFIPWKGTGTPDNLHWNLEQKNDKTLELIDRDVMVRSMSIYNELDMETSGLPE